jgi:hypothetical protein
MENSIAPTESCREACMRSRSAETAAAAARLGAVGQAQRPRGLPRHVPHGVQGVVAERPVPRSAA